MKSDKWKEVSQYEGPEQSPGFLLWQVSTKWRREIEKALRTIDLTHVQFVLLASLGWLTRDHQHVTQVELARHCSLDINVTSQVLRTLEKKELITREKLEGNERSKYPKLTPQGANIIQKAIPIVEQADLNFFRSLNLEEKQFTNLLKKL